MGDDFIERLARSIHERYVAARAADGETLAQNSSMAVWEDIPEDLRAANRAQARDVSRKLALIDCAVAARDRSGRFFAYTEAELDLLARCEHERWMSERVRSGWRYGARRDNLAKLHPDMIGWLELDDAVRQKDREAVAALPGLLADAGLAIVRGRERTTV